MKATGIVRRVDELGRVVIPKGLRRAMTIDEKDPMEIYVDRDSIILRKYVPACIFCGSTEEVQNYKGKLFCKECAYDMVKRAGE
ncbi:MAG: AbrB family transcriptional regulator [Peptococcaceae bacterium BICA1-7]|nr:MAG: AbrB family transcriptional regulator [Peptococcaceae bacterium BICA1-7]HBV98050.1 AbrB/MazE/SpoVT family DNA-binding domain-containing protein [Desulfotomaculum sp.]